MTTLATEIQRVRTMVRDWPQQDALSASVSDSATTLTVADATIYQPNWIIQVDTEPMLVRTASGTTVTVFRAARGGTAATHANAATVLIRPAFLDVEIIDALNAARDRCFPLIYKEVIDESLTTDSTSYEYTIPNLNSKPIPYLSQVELQEPGDTAFRLVRDWDVRRGTTPKLKFRQLQTPSSTIRVRGYGPFPHLTSTSDTVDSQWPANGEWLTVFYAASMLLASGEAGRVRQDSGIRDTREAANKPGTSAASGRDLLQRFIDLLNAAAMPPMPKHVVPTI